ncbi:MAG: 3-phosphoshikimate 1-carboxyvinyltransferase, partial [Bacillota bacterium]
NPTRSGFLEVVRDMGADIEYLNQQQSGGEPAADILVKSSQLHSTDIRGKIIPRLIDEIPIIAVLAAGAEGKTIIRDARELRVKETDRIQALASQLPALGVNIKPFEDGLIIKGPTAITGGCKLRSFGDHRIAMSLSIAGLTAGGPVQITGEESIRTSYPGFMDTLQQLSI